MKNYFEAPINIADDYGQHMYTWIKPPQSGEYVFKIEELTNNQYFVRVVAYFNDGRQDQQIFIIDLTKLKGNEKNNRANPRAPINRRVLGISTVFKY